MNTNSYFSHPERAPYQLGHLLKLMPADFSMRNPPTPEDRLIVEAAREHAINANETLMNGLEALGHIISYAGDNENCNGDQFVSLGALITHIAVESQFLQETEWLIRETLEAHDEITAAKAAKSTGKRVVTRTEVPA